MKSSISCLLFSVENLKIPVLLILVFSNTILSQDFTSRALCYGTHEGKIICSTGYMRNYPLSKIEAFIDQNKALVQRLYGEFAPDFSFSGNFRRKRSTLNYGGTRNRETTFHPYFLPEDLASNYVLLSYQN